MNSAVEKVNILLVDDRPEGIYTLEKVLACDEYNLVKAASGQEALKCLLDRDFALILLDVQMPIMDGFETATLIRARKRSSHVPIIFVTAISKDEQFVGKGYKSGAVDYLFKPINPEILKSKVAIFVELYIKNKKIKEQEVLLRERQLAEQREKFTRTRYDDLLRYESLANSVPHLIWRTDLEGRGEYFNQKWYEYTGLNLEQSAKGFFSIIHEDDLQKVQDTWANALADPKVDSFTYECRIRSKKTKKYKWFKNLVVAEKDSNQEKISWVGTSTDIDEMKAVERQKASFLSIASHELRTPLTAIKSSMELAGMLIAHKDFDPKNLQEILSVGTESSDQVNELLDEFLDFSRVESGRLSIRPSNTNLSQIVMKSVDSYLPRIKTLGKHHLETNVTQDVFCEVDGPRIRQVIDNLISNAIKYSPVDGCIKVNLAKRDEEIVLSVADQGIGIEASNLDKIFHPFKRVNEDEHIKGLGIGLYISSWIVKEHKGRIEVNSTLGKGSEFIVKLPKQLGNEARA